MNEDRTHLSDHLYAIDRFLRKAGIVAGGPGDADFLSVPNLLAVVEGLLDETARDLVPEGIPAQWVPWRGRVAESLSVCRQFRESEDWHEFRKFSERIRKELGISGNPEA